MEGCKMFVYRDGDRDSVCFEPRSDLGRLVLESDIDDKAKALAWMRKMLSECNDGNVTVDGESVSVNGDQIGVFLTAVFYVTREMQILEDRPFTLRRY